MFTRDRMVLFSKIFTFTLFLKCNLISLRVAPSWSNEIIWYICQRNAITGADRYEFLWSVTEILYPYIMCNAYTTRETKDIKKKLTKWKRKYFLARSFYENIIISVENCVTAHGTRSYHYDYMFFLPRHVVFVSILWKINITYCI